MVEARFVRSVSVGNTLGEGPLWSPLEERIYWTDIEGRSLYSADVDGEDLRMLALPHRLTSFCFTTHPDWLVAAFEDGFARLNIRTAERQMIAPIEADNPKTRMNDGRLGPDGCFWTGSMMEHGRDNASRHEGGKLYRLSPEGKVTEHLDGILISNAISWSVGGGRMYFADSPSHRIDVFDFDPGTGTMSNRRPFAESPPGIHPDGAVVDSQDHLWCAEWGAGRVVRYDPSGETDFILELPVTQPTCPAFGGKDGTRLYITSAHAGLDTTERAREPMAGDLLIYDLDVRGQDIALFDDQLMRTSS